MQKQLSTLLEREMTRKEFVATLTFGIASVMGMGTIFKLVKPEFAQSVTGHIQNAETPAGAPRHGYGMSAYGG